MTFSLLLFLLFILNFDALKRKHCGSTGAVEEIPLIPVDCPFLVFCVLCRFASLNLDAVADPHDAHAAAFPSDHNKPLLIVATVRANMSYHRPCGTSM